MLENAACTFCTKPIKINFDNDRNASLYAYDGYFSITAHTGRVVGNADMWEDSGDGFCSRQGLSFEELLDILPSVSEGLGKTVIIDSYKDSCSKKLLTAIDKEISVIHYTVIVDNRVVFDKNTMEHGSVTELRKQVVSFIARFIYDYQLAVLPAAEAIKWQGADII